MRGIFRIFRDKIFRHQPKPNELCCVCGKKMKQVTQVGGGERMHPKCWSTFFRNKVMSMVTPE